MATMTEDRMTIVINSLLASQPTTKLNRKRNREEKKEDIECSNEEAKIINKKGQTAKDFVHEVHILPDSMVWEYERRLKQVATRGVVKLFNAVNKQQKELQSRLDAVGSSETKRSKVLSGSVGKKEFLDMLKGGGGSGQKVATSDSATTSTKNSKKLKKKTSDAVVPNWSLLRDDTGLETAMESWQQQDDDNEEDDD